MKRRTNFNIKRLPQLRKSNPALTRAVTSVLFICTGIALGEAGRYYGLSHPWESPEPVLAQVQEPEGESAPETLPAAPAEETESLPETQPEEPAYEPAPDKLNLAYYFPEGSDPEEIINSYAGQVFQDLTIMDSQWLADIYELADIKPDFMAAHLGKSTASARGGYNPKAENHDPEDPSTWTINDWKKIHVSFVNGDGKAVSGYSNVKDILAMASVYTYYTDMMDVDTFESYAKQLWKDSHSYSLSMGKVYYCDGCIDKTDEEIAQEEELEESDAAFLSADANRVISDSDGSSGSGLAGAGSLGGSQAGSAPSGNGQTGSKASGNASGGSDASAPSQKTTVRTINSGKNYRPQGDGEAELDSGLNDSGKALASEPDSGLNDSEKALASGLDSGLNDSSKALAAGETGESGSLPSAAALPDTSQTDSGVNSSGMAQPSGTRDSSYGNSLPQTALPQANETVRTDESSQALAASQTAADAAPPSQEESAAQDYESGEVTVIRRNVAAQAAEQEAARYSSPSDPTVASMASDSDAVALASQAGADPAFSSQSETKSYEAEAGSKSSQGSGSASTDTDPDSRSASRSSQSHKDAKCPGHMDLYIRIRLLGLEDAKGLISKDAIGNNPENQRADGWKGWTKENLENVRSICQQDWFADYGLSISAISTSTPLTAQEINEYMSQLPPDLSETRRKIIHFALSSVGKVPYYWGGKASHAGYEGNNFGMLISADDKGRMLRGLDCSGWISWVYWSATGTQLSGSSTSSLILCGEKISRSQLKPGDIIVRTGTNAHVVMFLSWSANGQMNVIHESSASVNNVTIKTMEAAWPYYRKLVD